MASDICVVLSTSECCSCTCKRIILGHHREDFQIVSTPQHILRALQAQPRVTYVLLGLNLVLYLVGVGIALRVGGEASNQWFLSLAKSNEALQNGEIYRRAIPLPGQ